MRNDHMNGLKLWVRGAGLLVLVVLAVAVAAGPASAAFGVVGFDGQLTADGEGDVYSRTGGHPFAFTTQFEFTHHEDTQTGRPAPDAIAKDAFTDLPAGFIGNPGAVPKCSSEQLAKTATDQEWPMSEWCPIGSLVGIVTLNDGGLSLSYPLYSLQAPSTVVARLGFVFIGVPIVLDARVRSNGDYGITVGTSDISEGLPLIGIKVTIWGVPADPIHDQSRCYGSNFNFGESFCTGEPGNLQGGPNHAGVPSKAFLRLPTRCVAPGGAGIALHTDSWANPGVFTESSFLFHAAPYFPAAPGERGAPYGFTGCGEVPFDPTIDVAPSSNAPDSPSGLKVAIGVPTDGLENPAGIGQSDLRKVVVRLPEGMAVNPSAAGGLEACSSAQVALGSTGDVSCPDSSKIGTVLIDTPLLDAPLTGSVYLAAQGDNPFGSLLAVYLVARGPGVVFKLPGKLDADPSTGRLTATFDDLPQQPFAHATITMNSGPRAPLVTPAACGAGAVEAVLGGWNGKSVGRSNATSVDCTPGLGGFSPVFAAGTTDPRAGGYTPFTLAFSREDGEQNLSGLSVTLPPGLIGKLAGIPLCSDAQANAGACSDASRIGTVTAAAGAGPHPFPVQGKVFLTGGYNGGPFGEVVVIPAIAGPFNLGTVVVRGSIRIDPNTTQATVVSDPFPTILQGIPLRTRSVSVTLDRPGFIFNPTDCEPQTIAGSISSAQGATANVSSHFQAANCAALAFHPSFKVSTKARTSKAGGAFLDVKLTPGVGQANLGKVAVSLPKQLPSRLTTIQQACTKAVFDQNPASCPAGSNIGIATATTPVLANPVTGPVYLVSHGGAAFPDLVMILQGEGITAMVTGSINIKGGVTSSAFNSVPDLPISTFELNLPQGPHSALGTNLPAKAKGNLCGQNLVMPTTLTGQNNAQVKQNTKITVAGCPKAKKAKKAKPARKKHTQRAHSRGKGKQGK